MSTLEIVLVCVIFGSIALGLLYLLFSFKKKKEDSNKPAPVIEPVYPKAEPEQKVEPEQKPEPLKIIRKKSEIKINKKALKADSRNPSITKVFVNGKRVDEPEPEAEKVDQTPKNTDVMSDITAAPVGAFGAREPVFGASQNGQRSPFTSPNRSPIIGDRTNFTTRLIVSDDNNLSGVSGIGIAKALKESESKMSDIDDKTEDMVNDIRRRILGQRNPFLNDIAFESESKPKKGDLDQIDAKTLIVADMLNKPKYKKGA